MPIITRCARRATRLVAGGAGHLRAAKAAAHRAGRRAARQALRAGVEIVDRRPITGRDIA